MRTGFVFLAWLMFFPVAVQAQTEPGVKTKQSAETTPVAETDKAEGTKKSAIELMTSAPHTEAVSDGERPARVYRPKTPVYHAEHSENQPKPLTSKRHALVMYSQEHQGEVESAEAVE